MKTFLSAMLIAMFYSTSFFANAMSAPKDNRYNPQHTVKPHNNSKTDALSGRCRQYQINASIFGQGISTTVVLCCRGNNMTFPPITCFELPQGRGALRGYLLLNEFGPEAQEIFKKDKDLKTITITKSDFQDIEGKLYSIKSDTYKVLENDKKERYLEIVLEPKS